MIAASEKPGRTVRPIRVGSQLWNLLCGPGLWLLLSSFALYFLTSRFDFFISDGEVMYQTAREIALRGRLDQPATPGLPQIILGRDGLYYSKYGVGQPLVASLLFKAGRWLQFAFMQKKEAEPIAHLMVSLLPTIATALTVWLVYLFGKRLYGSVKIAIGLAVLYGLGTSAWPYSHFFFSEPLFTLATVAGAYAVFRAKDALNPYVRYAWLIAGGFGLGYAILTRVSGVALVPAFLLYLWFISDNRRQFVAQVIGFGVGLAPGILLTAFFNYVRFGNPVSSGYDGEGFTTPPWEGFWGLLFSTGKSVFMYSQVIIAAPFAARSFWRKFRPEAVLFGSLIIITVLYHSAWWAWYGGFSWGPRFLVPILPFAVLLTGVLLQKNSKRWVAVLFVALLPIAIGVQVLGTAVDFNQHLAFITRFEPGYDADYIWIPQKSPIRGNLKVFLASPDNNVARGLSLDQLGFTPQMAQIWSTSAVILLVLGIAIICYSYFKNSQRKEREDAKTQRTL